MWWLVGCGDGVDGRLLSSTETPLAAVPVVTGAAEAVTASDGGYSAPPGASVTFRYGGVEYVARSAREEPFHLPAMRKVQVSCPPDAACAVTLDFGTHADLAATARLTCEPGLRLPLDAPNYTPTAACDGGRALYVDARTDTLGLLPLGRPVEIRVDGATLGCEVWVDQVPLTPQGGGVFTGQALGAAWAGGRCGGRPLAPVALPPGEDRATLVAPAEGPEVSLAELAPWATELVVSDPAGWTLNVRPQPDGRFLLPALPAGDWRVEVRGAHPEQGSTTMWPVATAPGLVLMPAGQELSLGVWRSDGAPGSVPVRRP